MWNDMLGHQLPILPPIADFWAELSEIFAWIRSGAEVPQRAPIEAGAGEIAIRSRVLPMGIPLQARSPLEIIRFAAANRLCVDLGYDRSMRRIEPYSLRQTAEGNFVLHAIRTDSGEHRSYRVDRLEGASVTNQTFAPRYLIELTPSGPLAVAPAAAAPTGARMALRAAPARRQQSGVTYVMRCLSCGKTFERKTMSYTLNPHKTPSGYACPGRTGSYVRIKH